MLFSLSLLKAMLLLTQHPFPHPAALSSYSPCAGLDPWPCAGLDPWPSAAISVTSSFHRSSIKSRDEWERPLHWYKHQLLTFSNDVLHPCETVHHAERMPNRLLLVFISLRAPHLLQYRNVNTDDKRWQKDTRCYGSLHRPQGEHLLYIKTLDHWHPKLSKMPYDASLGHWSTQKNTEEHRMCVGLCESTA